MSLEAKNGMEVMVLMDLAETCKKLAEHPGATEKVRVKARQLVEEFNVLLPSRGKGTHAQHYGVMASHRATWEFYGI